MDLYRQDILDHYKHPHNFGHLRDADKKETLHNSACGDVVTIEIRFGKKGRVVEDIRFTGEGCAISKASSSLLTDKVKGMKIKDVMKLGKDDIFDLLKTQLTPSRIKCALLPLEAIQKTITEK